MVIAHGEPGSIETLDDCRDMFRDLEIWTYTEPSPGVSGAKRYFFYRRSPDAARRLWTVADPDSDVFKPESCRQHFPDLAWDCKRIRQGEADPCKKNSAVKMFVNCAAACHVFEIYSEIRVRQGSNLGGRSESATTLAARTIPLEDLETLAGRFPSIRDPQARAIAVESQATGSASAAETASATPRRPSRSRRCGEILRLDLKYREWLIWQCRSGEEDLMSFLQMTDKEGRVHPGIRRRRSR